jgi:hypothetical protein
MRECVAGRQAEYGGPQKMYQWLRDKKSGGWKRSLIPNTAELTTERTENTEDDLFMMRCV